ncbi:30S ribosomal protein S3ae [Candidatus Micrarchaeota archaeon]|nr:MAG: 30S ribosomal protein S3ae [Candidatus Micrarchaeota archaeon]
MVTIKKRKTQDTWKKKKWYTVVAPKIFDEVEVGTTVADADKKVLGRSIFVPLYNISKKAEHQFVKLKLKIKEIKGMTAHTELVGFQLSNDYIRRDIRRRRSMIRAIITFILKDGKKVRVTAYAFTYHKIKTSQKDAIRKIMIDAIIEKARGKSFETFVKDCAYGHYNKDIMKAIKVICPIRKVEIGKCKLV